MAWENIAPGVWVNDATGETAYGDYPPSTTSTGGTTPATDGVVPPGSQDEPEPDDDSGVFDLLGGGGTGQTTLGNDFEDLSVDQGAWQENLFDTVLRELITAGDELGVYRGEIMNFWNNNHVGMLEHIQETLINAFELGGGSQQRTQNYDYYTGTQLGFNKMIQTALTFMGSKWSDLTPHLGKVSRTRGGGGGGGSRALTEEEIRNQFDLDELARGVTDLWRRDLLDEPDDARKIAREYVDAVVAGKGQTNVHFESFVERKIEDTPRFASIYNRKPKSMKPSQYLQPYHQLALQLAGPEEAADIAIGGAQFGASAAAFNQRLRRSDAHTSSAPFINELEGRLTNLSGLLKG